MKNFSFSKYSQFFHYGDRVRPTRDWFVLITIAFVLLLVSVGWNIWIFVELANGQSLGPVPVARHTPIPTISVTSVQEVFKERAAEETNYQNNYHFVDPSAPGS